MTTVQHPAGAELDYKMMWAPTLGEDTIQSSTWTAPGLTIGTVSFTNTDTTVWLRGGTAGKSYRVTNSIVTSGARTDVRTFTLEVARV